MIMSKFKVGDVVVYSHNLYSSVRFEKGDTFKVTEVIGGCLSLESVESEHKPYGSYTADQFELVQEDAVLTPEEVFEHLREGKQLQVRVPTGSWWNIAEPKYVSYEDITTKEWRIKPAPEVIELNGKKYIEITE